MEDKGLPEQANLSTEQAAKWLGVSEDLFEGLASREDWLKPFYVGQGRRKLKRWRRYDIVCFSHILHCRQMLGINPEISSDETAT